MFQKYKPQIAYEKKQLLFNHTVSFYSLLIIEILSNKHMVPDNLLVNAETRLIIAEWLGAFSFGYFVRNAR
jgi:hypothetical protein